MKKRLFLFVAIVAVIACLFAISASADSINPSTSNAFGTLTTFDDPIGNTGIRNVKDDGTIARTVITDGNGNYYTVPTVYILTEYPKSTGEILKLDFSELTAALELSTTLNKKSIIRFEMPSDITFLAGSDVECLRSCSNMIEVKLNRGLKFWDNGTPKAFSGCSKLTEIDVSMVSFNQSNSVYSIFESCTALERVILPSEPYKNGDTAVNYATNYMFNLCSSLEEVENLYGFTSATTTVGEFMFRGCSKFADAKVWSGVTSIGGYAFNSTAITEVIMPDTVTSMGNHVFAQCKKITKVSLSKNLVSIGNYSFEGCSKLEKVFMPAPWLQATPQNLTLGNGVFKVTKSSGVTFYLMCTEAQMANYIDQSAYTDINTDCWKGATFVFSATLADKCNNFLGGHEKPASVNSCTSGGNCLVCATALAGIATEHNLVTTLTYPNGFAKNGVKATVCQNWERCTAENESVATNPIFASVGYSYREDTNRSGLTSGFTVDRNALNAFIALNPDADLTVSMFVVNPKYLGDNFFGEDGKVNASGGIIQIDISALEYDNYNYFIAGFSLEHMMTLELGFGLVVRNGESTELIQKVYGEGEVSVVKKTYTDSLGFKLDTVTVQSVDPAMVEALIAESKKEQE